MIVIARLLEQQFPFQSVLVQAMSRINLALAVSDNPDLLTFKDEDFDLSFALYGSKLSAETEDVFTGIADRIVISNSDTPGETIDITLPTATPLQDLVDTARAVPPPYSPGDLEEFNRVLMPDDSPHPDLFFTGGDGPNVAMGFGGNDVFDLGGGRDTVYITPGNDQIDGGPGKDTVSGEFFDGPVDFNLRRNTLTADVINATLKNIEGVHGSGYDDTITGNKKSNQLFGDDGDDTLDGGGGNDRLYGGPGDDTLKGGSGKDRIYGEAGDDTIQGQGGPNTLIGGAGNDSIYASNKGGTVKGGGGSDLIVGGAGKDNLSGGSGRDEIDGGAGNDKIGGGGGNDKLSGGREKDTVNGGLGADKIKGGAGDDTLKGGSGNDWLDGGEGDDTLVGGAGRDTLVFRASTPGRTEGDDTVLGYEPGKDTITIVEGASDEVSVTTKGGNTIIDYGNGTITIEDQILTRDQITFEFDL